eukprot:CAMPEP_0118933124 /NCGR_PEP_ID=MMETSP1169-20130426/11350_1 /TAXON_ID=36882 /ORGANISM="Pyramimonas obovata, Strain CCMP722" /LENGTH=128 /DNA_ID=CAMNT_0006875851 /DNA_START=216 /DNA_END=602 /DNA_ORIENTATION=-
MVQGIRHADMPPARVVSEGGGPRKEGHVCKKEAPSLVGGPREHEGHELNADERKALHQQKDEARLAEAAAHRQVRALNMEAGLKPSKRAKKEARLLAMKKAKDQGKDYDGEYGESGDEDDHEEVEYWE